MKKKVLVSLLTAAMVMSMGSAVVSAETVTANGDYTFEIIVKLSLIHI